jgi:hypothetical protein
MGGGQRFVLLARGINAGVSIGIELSMRKYVTGNCTENGTGQGSSIVFGHVRPRRFRAKAPDRATNHRLTPSVRRLSRVATSAATDSSRTVRFRRVSSRRDAGRVAMPRAVLRDGARDHPLRRRRTIRADLRVVACREAAGGWVHARLCGSVEAVRGWQHLRTTRRETARSGRERSGIGITVIRPGLPSCAAFGPYAADDPTHRADQASIHLCAVAGDVRAVHPGARPLKVASASWREVAPVATPGREQLGRTSE